MTGSTPRIQPRQPLLRRGLDYSLPVCMAATAAMQILAQMARRSPYEIAWRWDGLFFVLAVPMLGLWLFLLDALIPPG